MHRGEWHQLPLAGRCRAEANTHAADEAILLDRVQAKLVGASKLGLVILDACRNNPFLARMARTAGTRSVGRELGNTEPEGNVLVAYSVKHGTFVEDGAGQFASSLAARSWDRNSDGSASAPGPTPCTGGVGAKLPAVCWNFTMSDFCRSGPDCRNQPPTRAQHSR